MANLSNPSSAATAERSRITVVLSGHVDHGKSTIVGRLLHDRGMLPPGKVEAIKAECARRKVSFEWAFVTDALQAERAQGVTIDASHICLREPARDVVLVDAPGHHEFIRNMVSGAASSDAALLILDAREPLCEQARRHSCLLHLLGIRQVAAVINKMDMVGYDAQRYSALAGELTHYLSRVGLTTTAVVPTVGPDGDNILHRSTRMNWYSGPTLYEVLSSFAPVPLSAGRSLRLRVQDVYRDGEQRIIVGQIGAGRLFVGDQIIISPSNVPARVVALRTCSETADGAPSGASAGQSIGLTIDQPLFVSRGDLISHTLDLPFETNVFTARIFWFAQTELKPGRNLTFKMSCLDVTATISSIERVFDLAAGEPRREDSVGRNGIAEVTVRSEILLALDSFEKDPSGGRFMLLDGNEVVGGGTVLLDGYVDQRPLANAAARNVSTTRHRVTTEQRRKRNGCRGGVFWLTGLSGSGKSTIAMGAEQALFQLGYPVFVLDGDNLRNGLNVDLGFSPEERTENIRRAGEVATLFANAGMIVITAFISPYGSERGRARQMAPDGAFHEIYIKADVATCEARDPKGLYARARKGEIPDFTGISAPYEEPEHPDLILDTKTLSVEDSIATFVAFCRKHSKL
jgi:bifunctional enzyme CysN/CysC